MEANPIIPPDFTRQEGSEATILAANIFGVEDYRLDTKVLATEEGLQKLRMGFEMKGVFDGLDGLDWCSRQLSGEGFMDKDVASRIVVVAAHTAGGKHFKVAMAANYDTAVRGCLAQIAADLVKLN